jgi:hypothetical protein
MPFVIEPFTIKEVVDALKSISADSAKGSTGIESKILKDCADILAPHITKLYNNCLIHKKIPDDWKIAYLTPIYKGKGSKSELTNYRPISSLPEIAKKFESLVATRITNYMEENNLLSNCQFGFRKGLSCELALNTLISNIREKVDKKHFVIPVFLDLSKAFDTINHQLLLIKLKFYNFDDSTIALIENYLSNRTMIVKLNGSLSKSAKLEIGVPQGSVLGPLLFIIFINDLIYLQLQSKLIMFADDTTTLLSSLCIQDLTSKISIDLALIHEWLNHNHLILNWDKTVAILFQRTVQDYQSKHNPSIQLNNKSVKFVQETKILGITLDNKLKFDKHIAITVSSVNRKTFLISRNLKMFSSKVRSTLFKLFILPYFDYCSTIFIHYGYAASKLKIEACFSKSINRLLKLNLNESILTQQYELLKAYNILPPALRQLYHLCSFILIVLKNNKLELNKTIKSLKNTRDSRSCPYQLPLFKQEIGQFSFVTITIKLLNKFLHNKILNLKYSIIKGDIKKNIIQIYEASEAFYT